MQPEPQPQPGGGDVSADQRRGPPTSDPYREGEEAMSRTSIRRALVAVGLVSTLLPALPAAATCAQVRSDGAWTLADAPNPETPLPPNPGLPYWPSHVNPVKTARTLR